jgi:hypothetical protein
MRFLPREEKFFTLLIEQGKVITEAAQTLLDATKAGNSHLSPASEHIIRLEQRGDEITHDVFKRLNQTFITPLDPEDIHALASRLDDVLDGLEDASHRLVDYRLHSVPGEVVELCEILLQCSRQMEHAIEALNSDRKILDSCIEINRLEELADGLVRRVITRLFEQERDPILLIKQKEIIEILEATVDACEDVSNVLETVVVKNS